MTTDGGDGSGGGTPATGLIGALVKVIERLNDPILLAALGVSILLVLLAVLGPSDAQPIAIVLAVVAVVAMVIWAVVTSRDTGLRSDLRNRQRVADRAEVEGSKQGIRAPASGVRAQNTQDVGHDAVVRNSGQEITVTSTAEEREQDE